MPDFVRKIEKSRSEDLLPGETLEAATIAQPPGSFSHQMGGQLGGVVGMFIARKASENRRDRGAAVDATGMAAKVPSTGQLVLGITDQRLLFFAHGAMSGNPKELEAAVPLKDVRDMTLEKHKMTSSLTIRFNDNSTRLFECVKMAKPGPLVEAFHRLKGNRAA